MHLIAVENLHWWTNKQTEQTLCTLGNLLPLWSCKSTSIYFLKDFTPSLCSQFKFAMSCHLCQGGERHVISFVGLINMSLLGQQFQISWGMNGIAANGITDTCYRGALSLYALLSLFLRSAVKPCKARTGHQTRENVSQGRSPKRFRSVEPSHIMEVKQTKLWTWRWHHQPRLHCQTLSVEKIFFPTLGKGNMYTPIPFYCYLPLCQALSKAHSFTRWMWNWKKTLQQGFYRQVSALCVDSSHL